MDLALYFFFFNHSILRKRKKLICRQPSQAIRQNRESFWNQQIMGRLNMNHSEKTSMLKFQNQQKCLKRVKFFYSYIDFCGNRSGYSFFFFFFFLVWEECGQAYELMPELGELPHALGETRGNQKARIHSRERKNHLQKFRAVRNLCISESI